jgi:tetratricopeptide (TPR) repeat protein
MGMSVGDKVNYVIPNIPYVGIYNHTGENGLLIQGSTSVMAMVLEYWNPGETDFGQLNRLVKQSIDVNNRDSITMQDVRLIINQVGNFDARIDHIEINDLKKYINPDVKTPLFLFLPISNTDSAGVPYSPATLVIGIKENENKIIVHDYWLGNNLEITYDDFNNRMARINPSLRNKYLVVQPVDLKPALADVEKRSLTTYPNKTQVMSQISPMMSDYLRGYEALMERKYDETIKYYSKIERDQKFENFFPPYLKVLLYVQTGDSFLGKKEFDEALAYQKKAEELNHDLDKSFLDWPGYEMRSNEPGKYGQSMQSKRLLGDIYFAQEKYAEAKKAYLDALEIFPRHMILREKYTATQAKLSGD